MSKKPPSRPPRGAAKRGDSPRKKPPQRKKKKAQKNTNAVANALAAIEADDGQDRSRQEDPLKQDWVFKEGEILKGPVPGDVIASHARDGTLDKDCPVGHEVGEWRPLKSVPAFYKALKAGEDEREAKARKKNFERKQSRNGRLRVALLLALVVVPFLISAVGTRAVIAAKPWDDSKVWIAKVPPLIDLPQKEEKVAVATPEPIKRPALLPLEPLPDDDGKETGEDEVNKSKRVGKDRKGRGRRGSKKNKNKNKKNGKKNDKKSKSKESKVAQKDPVKKKKGTVRTLSKKQILSGLGKGKRGIGSCLRIEYKRNPNMPKTVTMGFVVANNGKAIQVEIKERRIRKGPLATCLRKTLGRLKWPEFYGERKYTEVPFKIGK